MASAVDSKAAPVRIIFDTDMHTDCDDAGTLALLHALANAGEADILAVVHTAPAVWGPACIEAINTWYGRPDLPIGWVNWPGYETDPTYELYRRAAGYVAESGRDYVEPVATRFPRAGKTLEDGIRLYRRTLAKAPDGSVVICATGMLHALARLLESAPGAGSPLTGTELVTRKVRLLVTMAKGDFPEGRDTFNWNCDRPSAARVLNHWPTPLAVMPLGDEYLTGGRLITETPEANPVRAVYDIYVKEPHKNRSSWDQLAMLYAVRGTAGLFREVGQGHRIQYDAETGRHVWTPDADAQQVCLELASDVPTVCKVVEDLMVQPPNIAAVPGTNG